MKRPTTIVKVAVTAICALNLLAYAAVMYGLFHILLLSFGNDLTTGTKLAAVCIAHVLFLAAYRLTDIDPVKQLLMVYFVWTKQL